MPRKRGDGTDAPLPTPPAPAVAPAAEWAHLPMESDFSAMHLACKAKGFSPGITGLAVIDPYQRHLIAMWATGQLADVPAVLLPFREPGTSVASAPAPAVVPATGPATSMQFTPSAPAAAPAGPRRRGEGAPAPAAPPPAPVVAPAAPVPAPVAPAPRVPVAPMPALPPQEGPVTAIHNHGSSAPVDYVYVVWAMEKYFPIIGTYNSFEIGPFAEWVPVHPGQDREAVRAARYAELARFAAAKREEKALGFFETLTRLRGAASSQGQ